jgi:hypothetical protein
MKKVFIYLLCAVIFSLFNSNRGIFAQQSSIINVPSSSFLQEGEIVIKDSTKFSTFHPDRFVSTSPSVIVGLPGNVNIQAGVNTNLGDGTEVEGRFSIKKVFFLDGATRLNIETRIDPNFMAATTPDNITYATISRRFRKTRTTITAGGYLANGDHFLPDKPGVVLGLEQHTFYKNLRVAVDWTSRNESYGVIGAGIKFRPFRTVSVTAGILIPNGDRADLAFKISVSKFFTP